MESGVINSVERNSEKCHKNDSVNVEKMLSSISLDSISELSNNNGNKIKVYLKIRPTNNVDSTSSRINKNDIFTILNKTNLETKIPINDTTLFSSNARQSKKIKNNDNLRKYKFTQIFNDKISQDEFFNEIGIQNVINFIKGESLTLMNYGTSNSGKTYSLFGLNDCLGLIPRCLKFLYFNIESTVSSIYKPINNNLMNSVKNFDEIEKIFDKKIKEKLFIERELNVNSFLNLEINLKMKKNEDIFNDYFYSIWISFFEIYNESIFDLLTTSEEGKNVHLKLVTDEKGNNYLKGVRKVFAATGEEAFQIMMAGKSRLKVASTAINSKSSRSHAIFTVTLLKYTENSSPQDVSVSIF